MIAGILVVLLALAALAQTDQPKATVERSHAPSSINNFRVASDVARDSVPKALDKDLRARASHRSGNDPGNPPLPVFVPAISFDAGAHHDTSVAVADLNHDGRLDVAVANETGVSVFLGNGDGTLQAAVVYETGGQNVFASEVKIADVNRDGKPDLIVLISYPQSVAVLLGKGDGTFQPAILTSDFAGANAIALADFNGDGILDLAVALAPGAVAVALGNGDGTFQPATGYASGGYVTGSVAAADVNGDGKVDLIASNPCNQYCPTGLAAGSVSILLGNGDGTFQAAVLNDTGVDNSGFVTVADLNGDGKLDLIVADAVVNGGTFLTSETVFLGKGDGTFPTATTYELFYGEGSAPPAVSDVNGDGVPDIVAAGFVLLGNGDGTFQLEPGSGWTSPGTAIADMNGDGRPDLVALDFCFGDCSDEGVDVYLHVGDVATTTTLTSTPNPAVFGQEVFTATVHSSSGTPTGTVNFYDEPDGFGSPVFTGTLAGGIATLTGPEASNWLNVGTSPVIAVYQGSLVHKPGFSQVVNQVLTPATTTMTVASSSNPGVVPTHILYTVTVTSQYGGWTGGTVSCQDNGSNLFPVRGAPRAFRQKYTAAATHTIICTYAGDQDNLGSAAPPLTEHIVDPTTTVLTTSGSPSLVGQTVIYTARVSSTYGAIPNGELVTFTYSNKVLGTASLSGGTAVISSAALPQGTHTVKAIYAGDSTFHTSYGKVTQVVQP